MSDKKRGSRRRKDDYTGPGEQELDKASKDEYKIAKWMKKNVKTKKTKFLSHNVEYFTSSKAIDALMQSKFTSIDAGSSDGKSGNNGGNGGSNVLFATREQIIEFLDVMLEHKFFHRAKKVPVTLEELRGNTTTTSSSSSAAATKSSTATSATSGANGEGGNGGNNSPTVDKKEKRKRKIRLDMHPEQIFVDGSEAYVWIYDPIPIHYWIYGFILVLGAIGICLFPLWPPMLRKGVYYLSVAAAGFLVFILALTVVRLIIFTVVWALTGSKLHFWIFPNLTEDVGFFASFWPLYESKYITDSNKSKSDKKSKKSKKKEKDSDAEDDASNPTDPIKTSKIEEIKEHDADIELRHRRNVTPAEVNGATIEDVEDGGGVDESQLPMKANVVDAKLTEPDTEEDSHSSGADNSEAVAESDVKSSSRTASESDSEISGKDYEIISSSEVQNVN